MRVVVVVPLLLAIAACGLGRPRPQPTAGAPVALVLEGPALAETTTRTRVADAVARQLGRHVVVVPTPDAEVVLRPIADRIVPPRRGRRRLPTSEPRCPDATAVLAAMQAGADAVVVVRASHDESTRPATAEDRDRASNGQGIAGALTALGVGDADTVRVERVHGEVRRTTFAGRVATERRPFDRSTRRVAPNVLHGRLDLPSEVAGALSPLPPVPPARWDEVARALTRSGCPLLAIAVSEARVDQPATRARLVGAATQAIARRSGSRRPAAVPVVTADTVPATPSPVAAVSCQTLCGLHVVELCNNDRALWSSHRVAFTGGRCGERRHEPFLEQCYRLQWLNGTYEQSCVRPCEASATGRERLAGRLRRAGCLRDGVTAAAAIR